MARRTEQALNGANIAVSLASIASAASVTGAAGAAISDALSGVALFWSQAAADRQRTADIARAVDAALDRLPAGDTQLLTRQLIAAFPVSEDDLAKGNRDAARVARLLRDRAADAATDPAQRQVHVLDAFERVLAAALADPLRALSPQAAFEKETLRRLDQLLEMARDAGRTDRLHAEGITETAIIRLAQRISAKTEDVGQAWLELQSAMDIAVRVQKEGHTPSNHGDFVDAVLRRVADLAAQGDYAGAGGALAQALAQEDAAHRARKSRLLDSAPEVAMLEGDADAAAGHLIARADLDAGGRADINDLRALQGSYHAKGRDQGTVLDLKIAIALARIYHTRARTEDERGAALNDLGNARAILGERESDPARLEAAVAAFRAALEVLTRDRVPVQWALTQQNLGTALQTLGARESGTANLEAAVAACRAALEETPRDRVPLDWAATQQNLGTALRALGERDSSTTRLEEAVAAYHFALEERHRERVPLNWAATQQNLGNALRALSERETGTVRLEGARTAYRAALEEWTRDRVPLQWAIVQFNLANVECAFFDKTGEAAHLDRAEGHARAAREVFAAAGASQYVGVTDDNLAEIIERRGG